MKRLAATREQDFVLSAGDNYYPGGIYGKCSNKDIALANARRDSTGQFAAYHDHMYAGPGLDGKPWLSVLGNHDYGGMNFDWAWDVQVYRTWMDYNGHGTQWRMPGQYWSQRVDYDGFSIDLFFIDTNFLDAQAPHLDKHHNMCGAGSTCWGVGQYDCPRFFRETWLGSVQMLERELQQSTADWRIVTTHFPGPSIAPLLKPWAHEIDLLFTGHTHFQTQGDSFGIDWIISGGGGGVTADAMPTFDGNDVAYGFVGFMATKDELKIEMRSWGGMDPGREIVTSTKVIKPKRSPRPSPVPAPKPEKPEEKPEVIV